MKKFHIQPKTDEERISKFILRKKDEGVTKLSVVDFVVGLGISAENVEKVLEKFLKEGRVTEWVEPTDGYVEF